MRTLQSIHTNHSRIFNKKHTLPEDISFRFTSFKIRCYICKSIEILEVNQSEFNEFKSQLYSVFLRIILIF